MGGHTVGRELGVSGILLRWLTGGRAVSGGSSWVSLQDGKHNR